MQVLLMDDDLERHEAVMSAFLKAGYQITATPSLKVATSVLIYGYVDLVIASERIDDKLTHKTALFAEHRNPNVSTIMITDRVEDIDELYELIPSVHCVVGRETSAELMLSLGRASVESQAGKIVLPEEDEPRSARRSYFAELGAAA